jgi:cytoskeletal protein CcmA (bactofilin family)
MASTGDSNISIIGQGTTVAGDLVTEGTIRIEGRVEGTVRAGKAVILGPAGEIVGEIVSHSAVIGGRVNGTIHAGSRLEVQSTAVIEGEIRAATQHVKVDEGARFNGRIQMGGGQEESPMRALPAKGGRILDQAEAFEAIEEVV